MSIQGTVFGVGYGPAQWHLPTAHFHRTVPYQPHVLPLHSNVDFFAPAMQAPESFSTSICAQRRHKNVLVEPVWVTRFDLEECRATVPQLFKRRERLPEKNVLVEPAWVTHFDLEECRATVPQLFKRRERLPEKFRVVVASMAFHKEGCWVVQEALDKAIAEVQVQIVSELRGHVLEATKSPHANHVVQKAIELLPLSKIEFILEELMGSVAQVAHDRYGVRIICRLLEHCPPEADAIKNLIAEASMDILELCFHKYGNFLARAILEYGTPEQCRPIMRVLIDDALRCAQRFHGAELIESALKTKLPETHALFEAFFEDESGFIVMACSRLGCRAAKVLLELPGNDGEKAKNVLQREKTEVQKSKHGRTVLRAAKVL